MFNKFQSISLLSIGLISMSVSAAVQEKSLHTLEQEITGKTLNDRLNSVLQAQSEQRYIVEFKGSEKNKSLPAGSQRAFSEHVAKNAIAAVKGKPLKVLKKQNMIVAKLDKKALASLLKNKDVKRVSVDHRRELMAQNTPYGYTMVEANQLIQNDISAQKVCVIDTGINRGHSDLPGTNDGLTGQSNNSSVGNWYNDGHGHGTHVAGIISAFDNSYGMVGVYPGVNLHIVKIFNDNGQWTYSSDLIDAVSQCQDAGAKVVNMSLGGTGSSAAERDAMQAFNQSGLLLVAAAGNAGTNAKSYPASYDAVVSVAAVQANGNRASYSQYNNKVELAAPGSSVLSTYPVDRYATMSGTSMATPHVSGAAALLWSFYPQCTNTEIRNALVATAEDKGYSGYDIHYGHGIIKVKQANDYLANNGCAADATEDPVGEDKPNQGVTETFSNISLDKRGWVRIQLNVPQDTNRITIRTAGGMGDLDLYMRHTKYPTLRNFECRSLNQGNTEECIIDNPAAGAWFAGLRGQSAFSGVDLTFSRE